MVCGSVVEHLPSVAKCSWQKQNQNQKYQKQTGRKTKHMSDKVAYDKGLVKAAHFHFSQPKIISFLLIHLK